jgi:hypothetical protein
MQTHNSYSLDTASAVIVPSGLIINFIERKDLATTLIRMNNFSQIAFGPLNVDVAKTNDSSDGGEANGRKDLLERSH